MNFVKTLIFSAALLSFSFPNAFAQNLEEKGRADLACRYIDLKMKEEPFKSGLTGILAVTLDGDTLISRNSLGKMIPASNTKLISTGLAIHGLGGRLPVYDQDRLHRTHLGRHAPRRPLHHRRRRPDIGLGRQDGPGKGLALFNVENGIDPKRHQTHKRPHHR